MKKRLRNTLAFLKDLIKEWNDSFESADHYDERNLLSQYYKQQEEENK